MVSAHSLVVLLLSLFTFYGVTCESDISTQSRNSYNSYGPNPGPGRPPRPGPGPGPAPSPSLSPSPSPSPPLARICRRSVLAPAVDCGCWRYSRDYVALAQWERLEELCLEVLDGDLMSGQRQCRRTSFSRGRGVNFRGMNTFFRNANRQCVPHGRSRSTRMATFRQTPFMSHAEMSFDMSPSVRMDQLHKVLRRFCFVVTIVTGTPKHKAAQICCPPGSS